MKKVLALVLAVMMLATVAFAVDKVNPGSKLKYAIGASGGDLTSIDSAPTVTKTSGTPVFTKEINGTNYSVASVKWDKGAALVASVTINSDGQLVIELKKDYTLEADITTAGSEKGKLLEGTFKINEKGSNKSASYSIGKGAGNGIYVGYTVVPYPLQEDSGSAMPSASNTIYKVEKNTTPDPDVAYNSVIIEDAMGNEISVRVYDGEKLFLASNLDANLDVVKKYDDADADLRFINFPAKPTFSSTATYYFFNAEETDFIYLVGANGAISASGAKYSEDDGCWVLKTRTLANYVISDKKLSATATVDENPDTGANDVVGIATALAAVALVSAAAVSLKK